MGVDFGGVLQFMPNWLNHSLEGLESAKIGQTRYEFITKLNDETVAGIRDSTLGKHGKSTRVTVCSPKHYDYFVVYRLQARMWFVWTQASCPVKVRI